MAKKDVSAIVSGGGLFLSIMTGLTSAVRKLGGSDDDIHRLATPDGERTLEEMAKLIVQTPSHTFSVTVDYGKSLPEMIAAGNYNWVNSDITSEHFPLTPPTAPVGSGPYRTLHDSPGTVTIELVHLNKMVSTEDVLAELERRGFRPANLAELLALGATYPDTQRQFPIIALGSVWQHPYGHRSVPCLYEDDGKRGLNLDWIGYDWHARCRFAVVRK